ncbi:MAG: ADOP family duplicated permease [Vicinamibacteraceae bacterium]
MAPRLAPPFIARRLLARALPRDIRDEVLGDLEQQFHGRTVGGTLWYWKQALGYALRFTLAAASAATRDLLSAALQPGWAQDLHQARRSLSRSWMLSLTITAILGIGLGATTAIFSICYAILLRPFPYPSPERLVRVDWLMPTGQSQGSSLGDVALWGQASRSFSGLGLFSNRATEIRSSGPAETVQMTYVDAATLPVLGVQPRTGRWFQPSENVPNGDVHKVVLSDALWRRHYGGDPNVIGRRLRATGQDLEVVGVMPPGFDFPNHTEMWVPVESSWTGTDASSPRRATVRIYGVIGRLRPDATGRQADDELATLARAAVNAHSEAVPRVRTWRESESGELRPYLLALVGGVACLLLICIANVSSLQLARGVARQREFAVRMAVGASMGGNLRIQVLESLLLALGGALLGSMVALLGVRAIRAWIPIDLPSWMHLEVGGRALLFCGALAAVSAVVSGVVPAWRASRQHAVPLIGSGSRGSTTRNHFRQVLVAAEVALSVLLLVGALLLLQTLLILQQRDPGFRTDGLLTIKVSRTYGEGSRLDRAEVLPVLHRRVLERLAALPGVTSASLSSRVPFADGTDSRTVADLYISGAQGDQSMKASFAGLADVSPEYFDSMGMRLLQGRYITRDDTADRRPVIVINHRAASALWPGQDAVGQQIGWGVPRPDNPPATVVGVVANIRSLASDADRNLDFYYPYAQYPADSLYYVLRTSVAPESLGEAARRAIHAIEPTIAVAAIKPLDQWVDESLWQTRLWSRLIGLFAGVALLLAAIGLYGVVAYLALLRSKEIVIRLAVGATNRQVAGLMLGGMLRLVGIGLVSGLLGSVAASRVLSAMLFQVSPTDLRTYVVVCFVVTSIALLACGPPILRASRVNPMSVLKEE